METQKVNITDSGIFYCPIGTEIMLRIENNETQLKGSLIGMDRNEFLILKTPLKSETKALFKVNTSVKGIFIHEGIIFGFLTRVLAAVSSPAPLFFLSFPDEVDKHELRKNLRVECSLPVVVRKDDKIDYTGIITDLSTGGCRIILGDDTRQPPSNIETDNVLKMYCEMLGIPEKRAVKCIVKNHRKDAKRLNIGFQFEAVDADILEQIQSYVNRIRGIIH